MPYDPFKKQEFPSEMVRQHFGPTSSGALAAKLEKENRPLYNQMRLQAVEEGLVPAQNGFRERGMRLGPTPYKPAEPVHDSATLIAMGKFNAETCKRWATGRLNEDDIKNFHEWVPIDPADTSADKVPSYARLEKKAPTVFETMRRAAIAHGVIPDTPRRTATQPEEKPADDGRVNLGDKLGSVVGLPGTYRVTVEQYNDVLQFANQVEAAKAK